MLICFKWFLTVLGDRLPASWLVQVQALVNYLRLGRWLREHGLIFPRRVKCREEVWAAAVARICDRKVAYLEFGVWQGAATRFWSAALKNPASQLHGFDSFEGLPDSGGPWSKGQFDVRGAIPVIPDPRVKFFKGWFEQVLPSYVMPPHELLVINLDADLYSSTIYVLRHLRPWIKPGTFIYFDEMNHLEHEPRALEEFMNESGLRFQPVCADRTLAFVFLECIG